VALRRVPQQQRADETLCRIARYVGGAHNGGVTEEVTMADDPPIWTGEREPMKHSDFFIGCEFLTQAGRWRCTDDRRETARRSSSQGPSLIRNAGGCE
jgi:hypothetical protein